MNRWQQPTIARLPGTEGDSKQGAPVKTSLLRNRAKLPSLYFARKVIFIAENLMAVINDLEGAITEQIVIYKIVGEPTATTTSPTIAALPLTAASAVSETSSANDIVDALPIKALPHKNATNIIALNEEQFASISSTEFKIWSISEEQDAHGKPLIYCKTFPHNGLGWEFGISLIYTGKYLIGDARLKEYRWTQFIWRLDLQTGVLDTLAIGASSLKNIVFSILSSDELAICLNDRVMVVNYSDPKLRVILENLFEGLRNRTFQIFGALPDSKIWFDISSSERVTRLSVWRATPQGIPLVKIREFNLNKLLGVPHMYSAVLTVDDAYVRRDGCILMRISYSAPLGAHRGGLVVRSNWGRNLAVNAELWLLNPYPIENMRLEKVADNVTNFIPPYELSSSYLIKTETANTSQFNLVDIELPASPTLTQCAKESLTAHFDELNNIFAPSLSQNWLPRELRSIVIEYTLPISFFPAQQIPSQLAFTRPEKFHVTQRLPRHLAYQLEAIYHQLRNNLAAAKESKSHADYPKNMESLALLTDLINLLNDPTNKSFKECVQSIRAQMHKAFCNRSWSDRASNFFGFNPWGAVLNEIEKATPMATTASARTTALTVKTDAGIDAKSAMTAQEPPKPTPMPPLNATAAAAVAATGPIPAVAMPAELSAPPTPRLQPGG